MFLPVKQKSLSLPRNFALTTKVNLLYLLNLIDLRYCLLFLVKRNCLQKKFFKNFNLDDPGISLPAFPSRTNPKLHNAHVTPKLVKKVMTNFYLPKVSGPECIPVVILKKCGPELSCILGEFFNNSLKESCFLDCWKMSSVVPVFKNVGERSMTKKKKKFQVRLLSVVSKVSEKLVNNRLDDHFRNKAFCLISNMVSGLFNQLQIF